MALMSTKGMSKSDPILVRLYKKESELEVWKQGVDGQYAMLKTYPICRWSGQLGPKRKEGDRQAPEGFYTVNPGHMNPNSSFHLSFDTGYPNAYDRAHGGTGSHLMVHGSCSSRGCYAMTDEGISEVYALAREAFSGGQRGFQLQAYPFRMTAENLAKYRHDTNMPFWRNLKEGADHFEVTKREPKVAVCGGKYAFNTVSECAEDPEIAPVVAQKRQEDNREVAELVAKGVPAVRLVYADGGGHESFRTTLASLSGASESGAFSILDARPRRNLGDVSRPDALAQGPREIAIDASGRPLPEGKAATQLASAEPTARRVPPSTRLAAAAAANGEIATAAARPSPQRVVLASADPDTSVSTEPAAPAEKPFYQRMLSGVLPDEPASAASRSASVAAPVAPASARSPAAGSAAIPPRRAAVAVGPVAPAKPSSLALPAPRPIPLKPQAGAPKLQRQVQAGVLMEGAQVLGPAPGAFKAN
jgi:murein L,D-transpeptidase YafK